MRILISNTVVFIWLLLSVSSHTFEEYGMPLARLFPGVDLWRLFVNSSIVGTALLCIACLIMSTKRNSIIVVTVCVILKILSFYLEYSNGKLITFYFLGMDRSLFEISIPFIYLILTTYYARNTYKITPVIPLIGVAGAINDLMNDVLLNPYDFNIEELYFMSTAVALILLYAINKRYRVIKLESDSL